MPPDDLQIDPLIAEKLINHSFDVIRWSIDGADHLKEIEFVDILRLFEVST